MSIFSSIADFGFTLVSFAGRMKRVENKQDEIVKNYMERFDEVKDRIRDSEVKIIREMSAKHEEIIKLINSK